MLCTNCNREIPDDSRFCGYCGAAAAAPAAQTEVSAPEETAVQLPPVTEELVQPKKPVKKPMVIGIAAVAVVLVVVLLVNLLSGGGMAYVYMSEGDYMLMTDLDGEAVEIASSKSGSGYSGTVVFSPDGKYLYYFTKFDSYDYTGTLCRAEYGKLKPGSTKNSKYIEVIDTNIYPRLQFWKDGVLYESGSGELYFFNGEESLRICKDAGSYALDTEKGRLLYETGSYYDGYELYAVSLDKLDEARLIASGYESAYNLSSFDNIVLSYEGEYEEVWNEEYGIYEYVSNGGLFVTGFDQAEPKELAQDGSIVMQTEDAVYYLVANGTMLNLYDYVEDDKKDADALVTEPNKSDYEIPAYDYRLIRDENAAEADCGELFTSTSEGLYWLGSGWWSYYSMTDSVGKEWSQNSEAVNAAMQAFIDKYKDSEDDNGLIPLTEEVKQDLKTITTAYYGAEGNQWITLCYEKYQSGTTYDYDAYNAAKDQYYEAAGRIGMREQLQDPSNAYPVRSLYRVSGGEAELICADLLDYKVVNNAILYNTVLMVDSKLDLDEVNYCANVEDLFELDEYAANQVYLTGSGKVCRMSDSAANSYGEACDNGYPSLWVYGEDVFLIDEDDTLSVASVRDGEVSNFVIITDSGELLGTDGEGVYYMSEVYESSDYYYGDLYYYTKGESKLKAMDLLAEYAYVYSDGRILGYTDGTYYNGYELTMFEKDGSSRVIADDVTRFVRVDEDTILYISDDSLYCLDKKEKRRIEEDVTQLWVKDAMEIVHLLYSSHNGY